MLSTAARDSTTVTQASCRKGQFCSPAPKALAPSHGFGDEDVDVDVDVRIRSIGDRIIKMFFFIGSYKMG